MNKHERECVEGKKHLSIMCLPNLPRLCSFNGWMILKGKLVNWATPELMIKCREINWLSQWLPNRTPELHIQIQARLDCGVIVVVQSCPTPYDPMDCSPPGSSVSGILRASILEWVAIPYSRDLPDPGIKPASLSSPALAGGFSTTEPLGKPQKQKFTALEETLAVLFLPPSVPNWLKSKYTN